jgi:hypothetical protein
MNYNTTKQELSKCDNGSWITHDYLTYVLFASTAQGTFQCWPHDNKYKKYDIIQKTAWKHVKVIKHHKCAQKGGRFVAERNTHRRGSGNDQAHKTHQTPQDDLLHEQGMVPR